MEYIKIKIHHDQVYRMLSELQSKMADLTPVMRKIAGAMQDSVEENFAQEGRPSWPRSRRAEKDGGKTLQKTGGLAASIWQKSTGAQAIVGTNKVYAGMMQFGAKKGQFGTKEVLVHGQVRYTKRGKRFGVRPHTRKQLLPWGTIPPRPFLMIQDEDWATMQRTLAGYLFTL
jgi:phage virion morphogenesis protein